MPVAAVAREPRSFDGHHRADVAAADGGQQAFEAGPRHARAGNPQIIVDNDDVGPAQRSRAFGQRILAPAALMVVLQLIGGGLADIDVGTAAQVLSADLAHDAPP